MGRIDHQQKNDETERQRGLGRKINNKGIDRKGESNDSNEIPAWSGGSSDIPRLPLEHKDMKKCFRPLSICMLMINGYNQNLLAPFIQYYSPLLSRFSALMPHVILNE